MKSVTTRFFGLMIYLAAGLGFVFPLGPNCGNNSQGAAAPPCDCPPSPCAGSSITPYTGNERHQVEDLKVWGSVGEEPLTWKRYYNSRAVYANNIFGNNQTWRHNYEWETSVATDATSITSITVYRPDGVVNRFSRVGATNQYVTTASIGDIIYATGTTSFTLQRPNGFQYLFKRVGTSSKWLMDSFTDSQQNLYTLTYDTKNRLTQVTDATGRYLKINYQVLQVSDATPTLLAKLGTTAPPESQWSTAPSTSTATFRYLFYRGPDKVYSDVAEVKFLDASGNPLTGTPFGSGTGSVAGNEYTKAYDGDTSTYFKSSIPTFDYTGIDLGTAKSVGTIQYYPQSGHAADMKSGTFYGSNVKPLSITVIQSVQTSDGRSVSYDYAMIQDLGMDQTWQTLTAAHYGDGTTATYTYTQVYPMTRPLVASANDPRVIATNATSLRWQYDNTTANIVGYVVKEMNGITGETMMTNNGTSDIKFANGGTMKMSIDHTTALMTSRTDSLGRITKNTFDQGGFGFVSSITDPKGQKTSYTRTAYGALLSQTNPDGSVETWTRDSLDRVLTHTDELGRVTMYTRDAVHRVTRMDYPDSSYETFAYNGFSQVTSHRMRNGATESAIYDARGLLTSKTDALGNVTTYTYNANDLVATVKDARNNITSFEYNERGLVTKVTHPDASFATYGYDANGVQTTMTNELGNTWTTVNDEFKRLVSSKDPLNRTTSYSYELPGGACGCSHDSAKPTKITLPSGKMVFITYDTEWQKTSETVGFGTVDAATTSYAYDFNGNLISMTDARGKAWTMVFDSRNRKISSTDPVANTTQWTYDLAGNNLTVKDALNRVTTNTYDVMNRLSTTTDAKNQTTSFFYDLAGNMTQMVDAKNNAYQNTYDLLNRKTAMIYPDNSKEQYGYDAVSNLITYTTRAAQVRTCTYDNRNRETKCDWNDSTPDVTRTFDALGRLLTSNNGISSITYTYNGANELVSELTQVAGGQPRAVAYTYTVDGNRASVTYPGGNVVSYDYTNRNQVSAVYEDGVPPMATYSYDLNGNRIVKTLENGTSATYVYDNVSRLTSIADKKGATSLFSTAYTLNAVGNRTAKAQDGKNESYSFDAIDQVTGVNYTGGTASTRSVNYNYDATGNRTSVVDNGISTAYQSNSLNAYTSVGGTALVNDTNGNLTNGGTIQSGLFFYDAQNRLTKATVGANTMEFFYDSKNRVVKRSLNGTNTYLVYDGWSLIEERTNGGTLSARYVHGPMTDEILARITTTSAYYYHHDGLGSTTMLTNASGTVVEKYTYDIFGKATITSATGAVRAATSYSNRFFFTGREYLKEVGLYDYRNRVYSESLGRFLQTDPIRFAAGDVNLYRYVGNDVVRFKDPTGLAWGNAEAVAWYFNPFNHDVTLQEIGLYDTVTASIKSDLEDVKKTAEEFGHKEGKKLCQSGGGSADISSQFTLGGQSGVFWIGGISLYYNITLSIVSDGKIYAFYGDVKTSMSDPFSHPFDFRNQKDKRFYEKMEPGKVFNVTGSWSNSVSGSGDCCS